MCVIHVQGTAFDTEQTLTYCMRCRCIKIHWDVYIASFVCASNKQRHINASEFHTLGTHSSLILPRCPLPCLTKAMPIKEP